MWGLAKSEAIYPWLSHWLSRISLTEHIVKLFIIEIIWIKVSIFSSVLFLFTGFAYMQMYENLLYKHLM